MGLAPSSGSEWASLSKRRFVVIDGTTVAIVGFGGFPPPEDKVPDLSVAVLGEMPSRNGGCRRPWLVHRFAGISYRICPGLLIDRHLPDKR
jgi:hypothetical protein